MAQVSVKINGYVYNVGCEDGQEAHLQAMAGAVEDRITSIKALGGQSGEARLLVLAALLMADELHDMQVELGNLRGDKPAPLRAVAGDPRLTDRLGRLASRAEEIAARLERP